MMTLTMTPTGTALIHVEGELNAVTSPVLKSQLNDLAANGPVRVVVDLSSVTFIDSSGLGALVAGLKAAKLAGGALVLAGLQDQARTIFEITMAYRLFDILPTPEEALRALAEE